MSHTLTQPWRLATLAAAVAFAPRRFAAGKNPNPPSRVKAAEPAKPAEPPPMVVKDRPWPAFTGGIAHRKDKRNGVRLAIGKPTPRDVTLDGKKVRVR